MKVCNDTDASGTSFHGTTIKTTARKIQSVMGRSAWSCNKTNFNWTGETDKGEVFTVYDWKEGPIDLDSEVYFHVGGFNKESTERAKNELLNIL
jgi:hypothetical protein